MSGQSPGTAFVTGVSGQDGSYAAESLLERGWQVHGLVQSLADGGWHPEGVVPHEGDLGDGERLRQLVADIAPDRILNFAGLSSVARSWEEPELTMQVTGVAPVVLLEAAWRLREATGRDVRFIQASSAEIFGVPAASPQDEETPIAPVSPYGAAKALAHHAVRVWRGRGLHASNAILYNHESPRRGEAFVTSKIVRGAVRIAGGDTEPLRLGNLDARRDWGWAPDYVEGMLLALERVEPDDYVLASGAAHTVRDFVAAAFAAVGIEDWARHVEIDPAFFRPVEASELRGNPARAERELGWTRTLTFEQIVAEMVRAESVAPDVPGSS